MAAALLVTDDALKPDELRAHLSSQDSPMVVVPHKHKWMSESLLTELMANYPSRWLLGTDGFTAKELRRLLNLGRVHAILKPNQDYFPSVRKIAGPESDQLVSTNRRLNALTSAMFGIQKAMSIGEIEVVLNEALNPALQLSWVRIAFENQRAPVDLPTTNLRQKVVSFNFSFKRDNLRGHILFGRESQDKFKNHEKKFLQEITDTAALAIERLGKLDAAETLKQQWEATFDAISHPLCLTTETFSILRTNLAFSKVTGISFLQLLGQNAFTMFLPDQKVEATPVGAFQFRIVKGEGLEKRHYDVVGQPVNFDWDKGNSQLLIFRDITEQLRIERRILEASKFAELGTIASSIAHELNNPLGGVLSFLQLIMMDLKPNDPRLTDIQAMEQATLRCRDIIVDLLGFARLRRTRELDPVNLGEVVHQVVATKQTEHQEVEIVFKSPASPSLIRGQAQSLGQALGNILQNSLDAVRERHRTDFKFVGRIDVEIRQVDAVFVVQIRDNGLGIRPEHEKQIFTPLFTTKAPATNAGLGLTVAYSIIREHSGDLEILSQPGISTTAVITLPALATPSDPVPRSVLSRD